MQLETMERQMLPCLLSFATCLDASTADFAVWKKALYIAGRANPIETERSDEA
jgi:hypothetical protein